MIVTKHLLKVGVAWTSIVYTVCYLGVALFPNIRTGFMKYALHADINQFSHITSFSTFISGLIIWNIIALIALWLFSTLYNNIRE